MTPRFIFNTRRWISILIMIFGILLLIQGAFYDKLKTDLNILSLNSIENIE